MVQKKEHKLSAISFEEITDALASDEKLRSALIKHLAKAHSSDYLAHVNINARLLSDVSARFISSNKEWQE